MRTAQRPLEFRSGQEPWWFLVLRGPALRTHDFDGDSAMSRR